MDRQLTEELEEIIGYHFRDRNLLIKALTHSSFLNENKNPDAFPEDNERLEFFGDAIIEFLVSEYLFRQYAGIAEGDLTRLRASLVCEQSLAQCSRQIRLGEFLRMGKGEEATGGRERASVTSDAFEALTAAIYLDSGWQSAEEFVREHLLRAMESGTLFFDAKTRLQETVQKKGGRNLQYEMISEEGPSHNKMFVAAACLDGREIGRGQGHSKKAAQQEAALAALKYLEKQ